MTPDYTQKCVSLELVEITDHYGTEGTPFPWFLGCGPERLGIKQMVYYDEIIINAQLC